MRKFEEFCPRAELKNTPAIRNQIIEEYAPLIKYIATRIHAGLPSNIELDDLISIGALGLIDAIDKFDMNRGVLFKTYAESRIRGKILDELRKLDWLPRGLRQKIRHWIVPTVSWASMRAGKSLTESWLRNWALMRQKFSSISPKPVGTPC